MTFTCLDQGLISAMALFAFYALPSSDWRLPRGSVFHLFTLLFAEVVGWPRFWRGPWAESLTRYTRDRVASFALETLCCLLS